MVLLGILLIGWLISIIVEIVDECQKLEKGQRLDEMSSFIWAVVFFGWLWPVYLLGLLCDVLGSIRK